MTGLGPVLMTGPRQGPTLTLALNLARLDSRTVGSSCSLTLGSDRDENHTESSQTPRTGSGHPRPNSARVPVLTRLASEVHLLAGKLVPVMAIHSLKGSCANWHHTPNPQ